MKIMKLTAKHLFLGLLIAISSLHITDSYADKQLYRQEIKMSINHRSPPYFVEPYSQYEQTILTELYQLNNNQLLWFNVADHPLFAINQLLSIFTQAPTYGLMSSDYASQFLNQRWQTIQQNNPPFTHFAHFDISLSLSLIRFLNDLHNGRISATQLQFHLPDKQKLTASTIFNAIKNNTLPQLITDSEPHHPAYQPLKKALITYRRLAKHYNPQPYFLFKPSLHPGDKSTQITELHNFLNALNGDFSAAIHSSSTYNNYSQDIVTKIQQLQTNNNLISDGIIGAQTLAILNTPIRQRIEQIELSLNRLRWLPEQKKGRSILVNIPAFQLWAFDTHQQKQAILKMKVIVGQSIARISNPHKFHTEAERRKEQKSLQTPIFSAKLRYLIFAPYWNIPKSIIKKDIFPKLKKQPDYLEKHNMEIVSYFSPHAQVLPNTPDNIIQLANNKLHLRQRPGANNALGKVKFIFPNSDAVYLHDTPAASLFQRTKRDFSHGCIRVAQPVALAQFILQGENINWNYQKSKEAMHSATPQKINIKQSIPVTLFYTTALATNSGVSFYPDIYGHDTKLKNALKTAQNQRRLKKANMMTQRMTNPVIEAKN